MTKPVRSMRKIMKTIFLFGLILVACVAGCHAQEKLDRDVARWTAVQPPPRSDWQKYYDFLNLANHSEHEWIVRQENGKVVASLKDDNKPSASDAPAFDTTVQLQASKGPANMFLKSTTAGLPPTTGANSGQQCIGSTRMGRSGRSFRIIRSISSWSTMVAFSRWRDWRIWSLEAQ